MADAHTKLEGSERPAPKNSVRRKEVDPTTPVELTITLKGRDLPSLDQLPTKALSREAIVKEFGVPEDTFQKVVRVLESYKLKVADVTQGRRSLKVEGSAADITSAFRPKFGIYEVPGERPFRAREGELQIPIELEGIVTGVFGLDQRRMAKGHADVAAREITASPLTPAKLEQRYNFPDGDGEGQTIAIAEFGVDLGNGLVAPAWIPSDVTSFCVSEGRDAPEIRIKPVGFSPLSKQQYERCLKQLPEDSQSRKLLQSWTLETMMDAQIVAALCPKADITIYFATLDEAGWVNLLDAVTSSEPAPVAVSISYGWAEEDPDWSPAARTAINERLQIAALQGVTVCVSSGDDGSYCNWSDDRCHVEFPSSSPYVLSVGGTMLVTREGGQVEEVWWETPGWSNGGGATGGGVSTRNHRPSWQNIEIQSLNPNAIDGRIVPDVSALAGPPLYQLLLDGQPTRNGGTSAATPLWASLIARINAKLPKEKRQRFLPPLLYKPGVGTTAFRDIESGNNRSLPHPGKGYEATKGFDAVSGWGAPHGRKLLDALETA